MPSAPRRVAVVAMVLLLRSAPVGCPMRAEPGLSSSRLPATMCDRRGGGLSRIDVFLRGLPLARRPAPRASGHAGAIGSTTDPLPVCPRATPNSVGTARELGWIGPPDRRPDGRDRPSRSRPGSRRRARLASARGSASAAHDERTNWRARWNGPTYSARTQLGQVHGCVRSRSRSSHAWGDELRRRRALGREGRAGRVAGRRGSPGRSAGAPARRQRPALRRQVANGLEGLPASGGGRARRLPHDDRALALGQDDACRVEQPAQARVPERPRELEVVELRPGRRR